MNESRAPRRRLGGDDGAVLVEFALFAPVAVVLLMGILEFGMAFRDANTVRSADRAAARAGANTFVGGGNSNVADWNILSSLKAGTASIASDEIVRVVIYDAGAADGDPPPACKTHTPGAGYGSPGTADCNVYTGAFLETLPATSAGWSTAYDAGWDPTERDVDSDGGTDYLGIWMQVDREAVTGFFGSTITITDKAVMQLEPDFD
jgi:hypothetical protein